MRLGGTANLSPDELNQEIEQRAAAIETGIDTTSGSASFSTLPKILTRYLQFLLMWCNSQPLPPTKLIY
jgi:predicted Zn-dependent peptidase